MEDNLASKPISFVCGRLGMGLLLRMRCFLSSSFTDELDFH